ncbi:MAG: HNH endonuclease [Bacteroidetes bacterium]|nr:HNH endonuclease [Bacteroidota bacterium]
MSSFFENKYFNTYYYANIVSNILTRDIETIGFISNFFSEEETVLYLAKPFEKRSALHSFIQHIIGDFFEDDMNENDQKYFKNGLYADSVLEEYGMSDDYSFRDFISDKKKITYEDVEKYHDELRLTGTLEELYERIGNEVFYLLFNNRKALLQFNDIVADYIKEVDVSEIQDYETKELFNEKGFLKRVRIPEWAKRAVFFRDRGKCCLCFKDLSGLLNTESARHYDHIVPLAQGGLNDVSNLQLLCSDCNLKKRHNQIATSNWYQSWY